MSFDSLQLHGLINKALQACDYTKPTPVQEQSIPAILAGKDVVACAQTGTGKTAAFILPALHQLCEQKANRQSRILILTPTRELADQITKAAKKYGRFLKFNIVSLVGGMPYHRQIKELSRGAEIIVATPGRLLDHIEQRRVNLSQIQTLVLDEADRMLDMGFIDDVKAIANMTPSKRQTLLFSATLDKQILSVVKTLLNKPTFIDLSSKNVAAPKISQQFFRTASAKEKNALLKHLLTDNQMYKAIIFSATKRHADVLAKQLTEDGLPAAALHGDLKQSARNRVVEKLHKGRIQFVVATDVAARGLDIRNISHVINYDLPRFCEDYVHRIGRTGRAGSEGEAISFVSPQDFKLLKNIERYIDKTVKLESDPLNPDEANNDFFDRPSKPKPKKRRRFAKKNGNPFAAKRVEERKKRQSKNNDDRFAKKPKRGGAKASSPKKHSSKKPQWKKTGNRIKKAS